MTFLIVLLVTLAVVLAIRPVIRKYPVVAYAVAIILDAAYFASMFGLMPQWANVLLVVLVRRGFVAIALFVIVMYVGVLPHGSKGRSYLVAIRATLAITACLLLFGHICSYFLPYVADLFAGRSRSFAIGISIACGVVLAILAAVLGVTSLRIVRKNMTGKRWLAIQKSAYVFYALMYAHSAFLIAPSAFAGSATAQVNFAVYTVIFGAYAVLRVARALADRKGRVETQKLRATELKEQVNG